MTIPDSTFTLAKAKAHLRVEHNDDDDIILSMLDAAVASVEMTTRRALTDREWDTRLDATELCAQSWVFHALLSPATGAQVFVTDENGDVAALTLGTDYVMGSSFGHTVLRLTELGAMQFPSDRQGIVGRIQWQAEASDHPLDLYAAVMLTLGDLYENREAQFVGIPVAPNPTIEKFVRPYVLDMHV